MNDDDFLDGFNSFIGLHGPNEKYDVDQEYLLASRFLNMKEIETLINSLDPTERKEIIKLGSKEYRASLRMQFDFSYISLDENEKYSFNYKHHDRYKYANLFIRLKELSQMKYEDIESKNYTLIEKKADIQNNSKVKPYFETFADKLLGITIDELLSWIDNSSDNKFFDCIKIKAEPFHHRNEKNQARIWGIVGFSGVFYPIFWDTEHDATNK